MDVTARAKPDASFLTAADLAEPVTRALGVGHVDIVEWTVESMKPGTGGATGALYRIRGNASATEVPHTWEVVLKVLRPQAGRLSTQGDVAAASGLEPHHYNYWRREALAYESGLLNEVAGVGAPRCFGVEEKDDGSIWIWLEALVDSRQSWSVERFAHVARALGRFNGAYVAVPAERPLPDHEWLSRRWLHSWLARWAPVTAEAIDPQTWADPRVSRAFPHGEAANDVVKRLATSQEVLLAALERVPHSLAHLDAFSRNIVLTADGGEVVLIDWAFVGHAALGEEVAQLVSGTLLFGDADRHAAREIGSAALASYIEGLAEAGWTGDSNVVRFGYAAAAALRWGMGWVRNVARLATADDERRARIERETGKSFDATVAANGALIAYLLELGEEALETRRNVP